MNAGARNPPFWAMEAGRRPGRAAHAAGRADSADGIGIPGRAGDAMPRNAPSVLETHRKSRFEHPVWECINLGE